MGPGYKDAITFLYSKGPSKTFKKTKKGTWKLVSTHKYKRNSEGKTGEAERWTAGRARKKKQQQPRTEARADAGIRSFAVQRRFPMLSYGHKGPSPESDKQQVHILLQGDLTLATTRLNNWIQKTQVTVWSQS